MHYRLVIYVGKLLNSFGKKIWKNGTLKMQSGHLTAYCITETVKKRLKTLKYVVHNGLQPVLLCWQVPQTPVTPLPSDIIPKEEFEKARTKASTDIDR